MLSLDLYYALKSKGLAIKVLHPEPSRPYGFKTDDKATSILGPDEITTKSIVCPKSSLIGRMRESWSFGMACSRFICQNQEKIACIYANAWPLFSQRMIVKTANRYRIPSVIHVQDVYPESLANKLNGLFGKLIFSLFLPMDKFILTSSTQVVAISRKMKDYLVQSRGINRDKVAVVINWQDESAFLNDHSVKENKIFTFMYMGNIGPVAGVDLLIDAFIEAHINNARLVIAGSGTLKETLQEKAKPYHSIEFWSVPNGKVPETQAKANVMLLPIKKGAARSSIPSKLPAYMFSAKPIIGCMDGDSDTAEAIRNAECGWVIEPENVSSLATKLKEVADIDLETLKRKGEKARMYGITHFSKEVNLKKLTEVILKTIKNQK